MDSQPIQNTASSPSGELKRSNLKSPKASLIDQIQKLSLLTKIISAAAVFLLLTFLVLLVLFLTNNQSEQSKSVSTTKVDAVEKERDRQNVASQTALEQLEPINQLEKAYDDSVGSDSSKRSLGIDTDGNAIIEYEISSKDGQLILKTSYENFADLAKRVFNIPTIKRLNVTTYANKFTDPFGKPNVFALKLQLTKETNSKINWSIKKYSYANYATILDLHEMNPDLTKDYKALTKK